MRTSAESIAADLAAPVSRRFESAIESAAIHIATVVFPVLDGAAASLGDSGIPPPSTLLGGSDASATFNYIWTPAIGECLELLSGEADPASHQQALARLFANALACGFPGSGNIRLSDPCDILWQDLLLPDVSTITFECSGSDRHVAIGREHTGRPSYVLRSDGGGPWQSSDVDSVIRIQSLHAPDTRHVDLIGAYESGGMPSWDLGFSLVGAIAEGDVRQVQGALDLLSDVNPLYRRWVTKVSRCVQIVESPDRRLESGSAKWQWGNTAISRLDDSIESLCSTCEMLIHENSHQYFHVLASLGKLASDTGEYFSPFPKAMRPLEPIVLGAHAFANVLAFYRDLLTARPELEGWARGQIRAIVKDVAEVRPLLEDTEKLTALGQAVVGPLLSILATIPSTA